MSKQAGIRILVASAHPAELFGLTVMINSQEDMEVVAQTGCIEDAMNLLGTHEPDIALIGADLVDEEAGARFGPLKRQHPRCRFVVLTSYRDDEDSAGALAGADACLLKGIASGELLQAIRREHSLAGANADRYPR